MSLSSRRTGLRRTILYLLALLAGLLAGPLCAVAYYWSLQSFSGHTLEALFVLVVLWLGLNIWLLRRLRPAGAQAQLAYVLFTCAYMLAGMLVFGILASGPL